MYLCVSDGVDATADGALRGQLLKCASKVREHHIDIDIYRYIDRFAYILLYIDIYVYIYTPMCVCGLTRARVRACVLYMCIYGLHIYIYIYMCILFGCVCVSNGVDAMGDGALRGQLLKCASKVREHI